jgi:predicted CXXCH cytochrome family protein
VQSASSRPLAIALLLGLALTLAPASAVSAAEKFKLRPGARGKLCVECHDGIAELLAKPFVHTPITKGDCSGCHNPHTSNHAKLLSADTTHVCQECHDDLVPAEAKSVHEVVLKGECLSCHDPHASENEKILIRAGSELCFGCHEAMGDKIEDAEFQHDPVTEDCLECHNPHASAEGPKLLKEGEPALCLECHDADAPFRKVHKNYPVTKARCTTCHDPHGSSNEAILYDNVHEPVADRECHQCHVGVASSPPFALKDTGFELCEGCHYDQVVDTFNKSRVHWPIFDRKGCLNCHAAHGSPQEALLRKPMLDLCGSCHADTLARQERSPTEHPPIADGECMECHSPHGSDNLFLFNEPTDIELCAECHEWQTHSTHPIGEKIIDPRNQNLTVRCASCHRAHGTQYEHFLYYETTNDLCVQCHVEYRR